MRLSNNELTVEINDFGAEIKSIVKKNVEYIWPGDPTYWKRSSPVLFPIVGRLLEDEYIYNGDTYHMSQHGFARDCMFTLVSSSNDQAQFMLKENKDTLKMYPFAFNLFIGYKLIKNEVIITWTIKNTNTYPMYFQIGAHPAFNFLNDSKIDVLKTTNYYQLLGTPSIKNIVKDQYIGTITVSDETFKNDALVYDQIDEVTIRDTQKSVTIKAKGFPYLGLWTTIVDHKNAPFVCIEPWHGIADFKGHNKVLIEKIGINKLDAGSTFNAFYSMILN